MTLTREMLTAAVPVKRERVDLPEFGEGQFAYVYGLTALEKANYDKSLMKPDMTGINKAKAVEIKPRLIVACLRDENGTPILSAEDVPVVNSWPSAVLERVHDVCQRLCNGSTTEEHEKNSGETLTD